MDPSTGSGQALRSFDRLRTGKLRRTLGKRRPYDDSDEIVAQLVGDGLTEYCGREIGVFALFIHRGKHQMRVCRLLQCRRLGIMAVLDHR
jgi:hypothetical protein